MLREARSMDLLPGESRHLLGEFREMLGQLPQALGEFRHTLARSIPI